MPETGPEGFTLDDAKRTWREYMVRAGLCDPERELKELAEQQKQKTRPKPRRRIY